MGWDTKSGMINFDPYNDDFLDLQLVKQWIGQKQMSSLAGVDKQTLSEID